MRRERGEGREVKGETEVVGSGELGVGREKAGRRGVVAGGVGAVARGGWVGGVETEPSPPAARAPLPEGEEGERR